jgi:hypothetical protein
MLIIKMFLAFRMEVMSKSSPPIEDALQGQRIQRMKEKIAQKAFVNATFNNISVILWWSVLLVEETRVPRENHRHAVNH